MTFPSQLSGSSATSGGARSGKGKAKRHATANDIIKPLSNWTPHIPKKTWVWAQLPTRTPCSTRQSPLEHCQATADDWLTNGQNEWSWQPAIVLDVRIDHQRYPDTLIPNLQNGWADVNFQPPLYHRGKPIPPYHSPENSENLPTVTEKRRGTQSIRLPVKMTSPGYSTTDAKSLSYWKDYVRDPLVTEGYPKGPWDVLYYIHYKGRNRRHDRWVRLDDLLPIECDPRTPDSLFLSLEILEEHYMNYSSSGLQLCTSNSKYSAFMKTMSNMRRAELQARKHSDAPNVSEPLSFLFHTELKLGGGSVNTRLRSAAAEVTGSDGCLSVSAFRPAHEYERRMQQGLADTKGRSDYVKLSQCFGRPWICWRIWHPQGHANPDNPDLVSKYIPPWTQTGGIGGTLALQCALQKMWVMAVFSMIEEVPVAQGTAIPNIENNLVAYSTPSEVPSYSLFEQVSRITNFRGWSEPTISQNFRLSQIYNGLTYRVFEYDKYASRPVAESPWVAHNGVNQGEKALEKWKRDHPNDQALSQIPLKEWKNSTLYHLELIPRTPPEKVAERSVGGDRKLLLNSNEFIDDSLTEKEKEKLLSHGPFFSEDQLKVLNRIPISDDDPPLMESFEPGGQGPASWEARLTAYSGPLKCLLSENQITTCAEDGLLGDTDVEEYDVMEQGSQTVHEQLTLIRTIDRVRLGNEEIDTWYFSPYPFLMHGASTLYICPCCLRYYPVEVEYDRHREICDTRHPPGHEIYRRNGIAIFEVDGAMAKSWCQNLCWLAKLFLDHKTLQYDVDPFLFYAVTQMTPSGEYNIQGFFSKEKNCSLGYNLACILTFPTSQRKGYGKILQAVSYIVTRIEGKLGSPEKPISDLGKKAYNSFWLEAALRPLGVVIQRWKHETKNEQLYFAEKFNEIDYRFPSPSDLEGSLPLSMTTSYNALWRQVARTFKHRSNPWAPNVVSMDSPADSSPKNQKAANECRYNNQLMVSLNDFSLSTGMCFADLISVLLNEGILRRINKKWVIWAPPKLIKEKLQKCGRACHLLQGNDFCFVPWDMKRRDIRHEATRSPSVRDLHPWPEDNKPLDEAQQQRLNKIKKQVKQITLQKQKIPVSKKRDAPSKSQSQDKQQVRTARTGVKRVKTSNINN